MSARPFDLPASDFQAFNFPASIARLWVDSSLQMMRATTELWTNLLDAAPSRSTTSTASPWWMPPQQTRVAAAAPWPSAFVGNAWASSWPQLLMPPSLPGSPAQAFFPWLSSPTPATAGNPFAVWQQMWLQAAAPSARLPWQPAAAPATTPDAWEPIATAYRTANGHAMAAVLRTMADVVEPNRPAFALPSFWPTALGTRH